MFDASGMETFIGWNFLVEDNWVVFQTSCIFDRCLRVVLLS